MDYIPGYSEVFSVMASDIVVLDTKVNRYGGVQVRQVYDCTCAQAERKLQVHSLREQQIMRASMCVNICM